MLIGIVRNTHVLLDFIYDRAIFESARVLRGMAVSQKPQLFVDYYSRLSHDERRTMNKCLIDSLLGKEEATERFGGIVVILLLALLERVAETGLEEFQSELLAELQNPTMRRCWLQDVGEVATFRQNWRYALGIISVLNKLRIPGARIVAKEMAASAASVQFRQALTEIISGGVL